ncbi:tetratricopeptide repeat (TPR)-like superfamily protein [Actinidia rufa]|uniref:Tetratricopeptide repeat (TPR)-like superfamily protein n=1 Tax=Actinidia rufa TaxID=165716 RepID=A0A7J0FH28_9ERIC|nr:tetratricopeptide repeat (TPR)-like superfamily protein [Actinidia rufa]
MLEQGSYCYLFAKTPMLRKYGFHLVLSGDLYKKCDQKTGKTFEVLGLQLPVIDTPSLKVVFEDHRTYASPEAVGVKESLWRSLEEDMIPALSTIKSNWLDLQPKLLPKKHKESNVCVAGDATSLTNENGNNDRFRNIASSGECSSDASSFIVSEVDISLGGGETLLALPKVEGFIRHLPKTVYAGDLRSLDLVLKNPSAISVKNMKMKISHPRFLILGNQEVMDLEFPACLEKKTNSACSDAQAKTNYASDTVFQFPEDALIHGETPFVWPLWIRAATHGNISMYITVYYEMGDTSTVMNYRTLRIHYNLEVLPSLDVSFQISPCSLRLGEFLVRMDVVNRTSSKNFQIHQLSSVGNEWEISLLQPIDTIFPSELLLAGQALSCFFKLKNSRKSVLIDDENSSTAPLEGSDVSLSHRSHDLLFDICRSPLVDFHHSERVHQGMENQEKSNTVDFILISRQQRSEGDSEEHNSLNILSHHACACRQDCTF